ncbi:DUF5959 family protein [Streptomyces sp. JJ38]|uniref:DUF5959 family protein n=1 Tax=Streptomyces sp. JJ38 TaxID=2738128 RepID=UPI001C5791DD|nr:DUF5959 family protein [Streptomyces sp. JJ38]MBW1597816.1 hypothetical protein [Streptomyces sp. JJ38]
MDLINLTDEEQGVVINVTNGEKFGSQEGFDALRCDITISSDFINGHLELYVTLYDLDSWSSALDTLSSGDGITWLEGGRSPRIMIDLEGESGCTEISVYDVVDSQIFATIPVRTAENWITTHRAMLNAVRSAFPLTP